MKIRKLAIGSCSLILAVASAQADPLGVASAFNLLAIGSTDWQGDVNTSADVAGRVAAAHMVATGTTIGSGIADPYSSPYLLVSPAGFTPGETFNLNANGNVYAPGSAGTLNFNAGGARVTSGGSGIDFDALRFYLQNYSAQLAALTPNGTVGANQDPHNPSFLQLYGTSSVLNVFNVTAAQLASANNPLDIQAPVGSTILINVFDSSAIVSGALHYLGVQHAGDDQSDNRILFNFPNATAVTINAQFSASVLAPYAYLTGTSQMDGSFIAAEIGQTGEVHDPLFQGELPPYSCVPEPGSSALVGGSLVAAFAALAGARRRKLQAGC